MNTGADKRVWVHSMLLNLNICWDGNRFDIQNPLTGEYHKDYIEYRQALAQEREARLQERQAAEAQIA